jgi:hypothetical protein
MATIERQFVLIGTFYHGSSMYCILTPSV